MAEGIARHLVETGLLGPSAFDWTFVSAGVSAGSGHPATPEAVAAMRTYGIDIVEHRSQPVTPELVEQAAFCFGMTGHHVQALRELAPECGGTIEPISPFDEVPDPYGAGQQVYDETARTLYELVLWRLQECIV
ncbi:MAG: hypothetical protein D8M59_14105 [Planctomycetes bacterium]|nr:hypothetical protein [Planctomycetota bacterium]NOG55641.1 hypothetical protein [Planctomycetota bacterium]